jgi:hypothetical protein
MRIKQRHETATRPEHNCSSNLLTLSRYERIWNMLPISVVQPISANSILIDLARQVEECENIKII